MTKNDDRNVVALKKMGVTDFHPLRDESGKVYAYHAIVPLAVILMADYQRGVSLDHCNKIGGEEGKSFNLRACPSLCLSFRSGNLWCFDGQHRATTMTNLGYVDHYAIIHVGLSYEEEAELFYIMNNVHRKMGGWVKFKAAYNARNPVMHALIRMCEKYHLTQPVTCNLARVQDADIKSADYLLWAYQKGGLELADTVCRVLHECWRVGGRKGPVSQDAKETGLIRGLTSFLKQHYFGDNSLPWPTIRLVLRNIQPSQITEMAKKRPAKRTDQAQYHEALCECFGRSKNVTSPSCHLRRIA